MADADAEDTHVDKDSDAIFIFGRAVITSVVGDDVGSSRNRDGIAF